MRSVVPGIKLLSLNKYCLDTHSLIWYFSRYSTLSKHAFGVLESIFRGEAIGIIPTLVILEAFYVSLKDESFLFSEFINWISSENILILPFDDKILLQCFKLPRNLDIHDRVIVATSIYTESILVTKDRKIRTVADLKVLW